MRAVAAVFGLLLFRMRDAGRGAPSTTIIWPSEDPVATNRLPSWSMMETQQTPGRLAAALTAGLRSTWTLAAIASLVAAPRASVAATGVLAASFEGVTPVVPALARALSGLASRYISRARTFC